MVFLTAKTTSIPFARVMVRLNNMAKSTDALLEKNFDMLKNLVNDVLVSKQEEEHK